MHCGEHSIHYCLYNSMVSVGSLSDVRGESVSPSVSDPSGVRVGFVSCPSGVRRYNDTLSRCVCYCICYTTVNVMDSQ